ncbi:MAG: deoxynucleoside kinase [Bacteroidetes bacterium]|nr:deoxynucleoside kinase [Bacteroidota bacterium]
MQHWRYLVVEGNIGAGKTTLSTMLSEHFSARLVLEQFSDNPFLPGFYEDPNKFAFPLELSFLAERYQQLKDELSRPDLFRPLIVADYFVLKSLIFAQITLEQHEFELFSRLFKIIRDSLPLPDKIIFLHSNRERLKSNIQERGRSYEQNIQDEYLEKIQNGYFGLLKSLETLPVALVDASGVDFVKNPEDFQRFVRLADMRLEPGVHYFDAERLYTL